MLGSGLFNDCIVGQTLDSVGTSNTLSGGGLLHVKCLTFICVRWMRNVHAEYIIDSEHDIYWPNKPCYILLNFGVDV